MVSAKVTITNPTGLHLRPAGLLCNKAAMYKCKVHYNHRNSEVNAKSVLSVLGSQVKFGDEIEIICDGEDEEEALQGLKELVEAGLGE